MFKEKQPDSTEACLADRVIGPGPGPKDNNRSLDTHEYQK